MGREHSVYVNFLCPIAALAAVIEHQAGSTVLGVGLSLVAVIEMVLVCWVRVESVSLASTEARACVSTAAATTGLGLGLRLGLAGWLDWREWVSASTAGWREKTH